MDIETREAESSIPHNIIKRKILRNELKHGEKLTVMTSNDSIIGVDGSVNIKWQNSNRLTQLGSAD